MKNYTSKIATIVYSNYTKNVDMNNSLFNQGELDALVAKDSDIIRVDYFFDGKLILIIKDSDKKGKYRNTFIEVNSDSECIINGKEYIYNVYNEDWIGKYAYFFLIVGDGRSKLMFRLI